MSKNEMITLPREVVEQVLEALIYCEAPDSSSGDQRFQAAIALRAALEQPQPDPAPYLYYDPENGDTWTQEAINDGCCQPDGLIALYTK